MDERRLEAPFSAVHQELSGFSKAPKHGNSLVTLHPITSVKAALDYANI